MTKHPSWRKAQDVLVASGQLGTRRWETLHAVAGLKPDEWCGNSKCPLPHKTKQYG